MRFLMRLAVLMAGVAVGPAAAVEAGVVRQVGGHLYTWHKIQDAVDVSQAGDTVLVHPGVYHEVVTLKGGLRLHASPDGPVVIDASGLTAAGNQDYIVGWAPTSDAIEVIGFVLQDDTENVLHSGILVRGTNHLVENNTLLQQAGTNIRLLRARRCTVVGNIGYANAAQVGLALNDSNENRLINNIMAATRRGLVMKDSAANLISGNIFIGGQGMRLMASPDNTFEHITAYGSPTPGPALYVEFSTGITVNNSILYGTDVALQTQGNSAVMVSYSDLYAQQGVPTDGVGITLGKGVLFANPQFTASILDLRLSTTSPARNAGQGVDRDGTRADMGAYGGVH